MTEYLIHFNQQWVPDMPEEWFEGRGELAMAVVREMDAAGVVVFAGGLDEDIATAFTADAAGGFSDGPYRSGGEFVGGLTIVSVADEDEARKWAGKIAVACGWPQEVRAFKPPMKG